MAPLANTRLSIGECSSRAVVGTVSLVPQSIKAFLGQIAFAITAVEPHQALLALESVGTFAAPHRTIGVEPAFDDIHHGCNYSDQCVLHNVGCIISLQTVDVVGTSLAALRTRDTQVQVGVGAGWASGNAGFVGHFERGVTVSALGGGWAEAGRARGVARQATYEFTVFVSRSWAVQNTLTHELDIWTHARSAVVAIGTSLA